MFGVRVRDALLALHASEGCSHIDTELHLASHGLILPVLELISHLDVGGKVYIVQIARGLLMRCMRPRALECIDRGCREYRLDFDRGPPFEVTLL